MKKNGFTLAEVLITLAIIGVVATLTLPALMSNTQEQQAITGFRKAMNTLNEVGQMNAAVDGFDYSSIATNTAPSSRAVYNSSTGVLEQSVWGILASKAQVDVTQSGTADIGGGCVSGMRQAFFRDGTVLCYENTTTANANNVIKGIIDTNGRKAPNLVSSCGDNNCAKAAEKNIKDQFRVTLRGANAIPGYITVSGNGDITEGSDSADKAARWAMRK